MFYLILSYLHFFSLTAYLALAVFIIKKSPRSAVNRVCSILFFLFALWSLGNMAGVIPYTTEEARIITSRIGAVGWIGFASVLLWLSLALTERTAVLAKKSFYVLIFLVPAVLYYFQFTEFAISGYVKTYYGWKSVWSDSFWSYLFYAYYLAFSFLAFLLMYGYRSRIKSAINKRQISVIMLVLLISLGIGTLTDVVLPKAGYGSSSYASIILIIWAAGLTYAITKYGLMSSSLNSFAENIISSMGEALIIFDNEGKAIGTNKAVEKMTGFSHDEIMSDPSRQFIEKDFIRGLIDGIYAEGQMKPFRTEIKGAKGNIPVLISVSPLAASNKEILGFILIMNDLTLLNEAEEKLEKTNSALREKIGELEKFQNLSVGRELKMIELKKEISRLKQLG